MGKCKRCDSEIHWLKDAYDKWQPFDDNKYTTHHYFTCADTKPKFKVGDLIKFNTIDGGVRICKVENLSNLTYVGEEPQDKAYGSPYYIVRYLYLGNFTKQKTIKCGPFDNNVKAQPHKVENPEVVMTLFG